MGNRKRWYAELAGTILVWVEEWSTNDPPFTWKAYLIRRPLKIGEQICEFCPDQFDDKSKESAIGNVSLTIRNASQFREYAHCLDGLRWYECDLPEEEWNSQVRHFIASGSIPKAS